MARILLPVDESSTRARKVAESILELPGDTAKLEVIILNVFDDFEVTGEGGKVSSDEFFEEDDLPESAEIASEILESEGASVDLRRKHGEPSEEIINIAESASVDFIALTGRKRSPAGKAIFGSVTQTVLLNSNHPIIYASDQIR